MKKRNLITVTGLVLGVFALFAFAQSGGTFEMRKNAIAGGGGTAASGTFTINGTIGEPVAGTRSSGVAFSLASGLWGTIIAPTAATVTVSGRVVNESGIGLGKVRVTLMGSGMTSPRTVLTSPLGYFAFSEIEAGQTYIVSVASKHYGFGQPTQAITVLDNITDVVFVSTWQN